MFKIIFAIILIVSNSHAITFNIIAITTEPAFNYFASLNFWLLLISAPMFLVISLLKYLKKGL
jgi:hypothetical protein